MKFATLYIEQFLLRLTADLTSVISLVSPVLTNPRPYIWHHNFTHTMYDTATNFKQNEPRSILTIRNKIWNSKETSHFKPHRTFHSSLQTHTLETSTPFKTPNQPCGYCQNSVWRLWRLESLRAQTSEHAVAVLVESKLPRHLPKFQRQARDGSTDRGFSKKKKKNWNDNLKQPSTL